MYYNKRLKKYDERKSINFKECRTHYVPDFNQISKTLSAKMSRKIQKKEPFSFKTLRLM